MTFHLGRWIRTTDWYPDYQLRLYDRRHARWTSAACTSRSRSTAGSAGFAASCSTSPTAISRTTCRRSIATRRSRRAQMHEQGQRAGLADLLSAPAAGVPAQLRAPRRLPRRRAGPDHLAAERVLRDAEVREAVGATASATRLIFPCSPSTSTRARTWRGGQNQVLLTVHGLRALGHRAVLVAHPGRRAASARVGRPRSRSRSRRGTRWTCRGLAALADRQTAAGPTSSTRTIRTRRGRRRAGAVVRRAHAAAAARRLAARRLPPEAQLVLALEVPAGRLLHRRLARRSSDARRGRRRARPGRDRARGHRRRPRARRAPPSTSTRSSGCRLTRRSSATSPRSCRTRASAT